MRLYVTDKETGERIYLQIWAKNRKDLFSSVGAESFQVNGKQFLIEDVNAEIGSDNTAISAAVGAFIGLIGGTPGVIIGGILGGLLGNEKTKEQQHEADEFNRSKI